MNFCYGFGNDVVVYFVVCLYVNLFVFVVIKDCFQFGLQVWYGDFLFCDCYMLVGFDYKNKRFFIQFDFGGRSFWKIDFDFLLYQWSGYYEYD